MTAIPSVPRVDLQRQVQKHPKYDIPVLIQPIEILNSALLGTHKQEVKLHLSIPSSLHIILEVHLQHSLHLHVGQVPTHKLARQIQRYVNCIHIVLVL